MKYFIASLSWLFLAGCSVFGIPTVEEAKYDVLQKSDAFEVRYYKPQIIAQTQDQGDLDQASNRSFRRLFDYISGKNTARQKIAMTAPVVQENPSEKITMTAPVSLEKSGNIWLMAFVLPDSYSLATAPAPSDNSITIKAIPGKKTAVLSYSGFLSEQSIAEKTKELQNWLAEQGYKAVSPARSAGFDPPWTLPFLRRNEAHIDIE